MQSGSYWSGLRYLSVSSCICMTLSTSIQPYDSAIAFLRNVARMSQVSENKAEVSEMVVALLLAG